jgi:hypothetical protein
LAKIYVSSTFQDLKSHREQVERVIRRMGHQDVAMEYYVAEDQRPVAKCLADVASCDVYIGIFAWRYGWQPKEDNPSQRSITEMEYLEAHKLQKKCLIFLLSEDAPWPKRHIDKDTTKVENLRNTASAHHTADYFVTEDELARKVTEALHRWQTRELITGNSTARKLTIQQREDFAHLVVAGNLTLQREHLCRRLGLNPALLGFTENTSALDFAIELIAYCEEKELGDALIKLLTLVTQELGDGTTHQAKITDLREILEHSHSPTREIRNAPSTLSPNHQTPSIESNDARYTDTHIMSVLQIWSPMVVVWFFLLLLAPALYRKQIVQYRNSTARNIHISLGCFLAYLPLLILGLGADLESSSISFAGTNWLRITWLAIVIAWLTTMVIGRIDKDDIGFAIGIGIGILFSLTMGWAIPIVFSLPFGWLTIITIVCISVTGGTAYSVAFQTINDRNVLGAGIGAFVLAVLGSVVLILLGQILGLADLTSGGFYAFLTVIGAMAVSQGVESGLEKNLSTHSTSRRGVFTFVSFIVCLAALFFVYLL